MQIADHLQYSVNQFFSAINDFLKLMITSFAFAVALQVCDPKIIRGCNRCTHIQEDASLLFNKKIGC